MDITFTFGSSNPLPLTPQGQNSGATGAEASTLELHVTRSVGKVRTGEIRTGEIRTGAIDGEVLACEGRSGDGVSYARAERALSSSDPAGLATALRSVLARAGAELPEPLLGTVTGIVLDLGPDGLPVLAELGIASGAEHAGYVVDDALQARTGIAAGTRIRLHDE